MMKIKWLLFLAMVVSFQLQTAENPGTKIAQDVKKANQGFKSEISSMEMTLIDAHGTKTVRQMQGKVLEVENDGNKSLSLFLSPLDVKGTKMLTWSHKNEDDDQWLYLPSLNRVKRITSSGRSSSFMGSEFSFEDLGSQEVEKFDYTLMKEEKVEGELCWILERRPKKESGYSKQMITMSQKYMNPLRIDYYDRKDLLLKTAVFKEFQSYDVGGKKQWRSNSIEMKNVQTQKQSLFVWKERLLGGKVKEQEFEQTGLTK